MKRLLLLVLLLSLSMLGCQNMHQNNKRTVQQHWNQARSQLGYDLADRQYKAGEFSKALTSVKNVIEINPQFTPAHILMGRILMEQNRLGPAQRSFESTLKLDPCCVEAHYSLGILWEKRGSLERALESYQKARHLQSKHAPYLLAVAETLVALDRQKEALELLQEYIDNENQVEPDASVYLAAGNILLNMNKPNEAAEMFRQCAYLQPDDPFVTESLAYALFEADKIAESVELFEQLRQKSEKGSKKFAWANYLALGDGYMKLGRYYKAQRCYEAVAEHDNSNPEVWIRLWQAALARNDLNGARHYLDKALVLQPNDVNAQLALAYLALKTNEYTRAEEILRQIITADNNNSLAYCLLGQTLQARSQTSQAHDCYDRALKIDPQDNLARKLMLDLQKEQPTPPEKQK